LKEVKTFPKIPSFLLLDLRNNLLKEEGHTFAEKETMFFLLLNVQKTAFGFDF
jgi:hypothetical protein